ncbi:MAG: porin [Sutterellaceae bacterium]|nr:porin [Sutterellaceae bacterium]
MKKTLLALSVAGAFAASAMAAQVEVYGLIDMGLSYTHSDADQAGVANEDQLRMVQGQEFGSRFGFRGSEDLGNGYKIGFTLENGFHPDTGALYTGGAIFDREANIDVQTPYGEFRFGRLPIFGSTLAANGLFRAIDPLFANTTRGFGSGMASASMWTRVSNAVSYRTPTFAGLTGYAMFSFKNDNDTEAKTGVEGKADADRYASLALRYQNGSFEGIFVADTTMYGNHRYLAADERTGHDDDGMTFTLGGNYTFDNGLKVLVFGQYFKDQELNYQQRGGVLSTGIREMTKTTSVTGYGFLDGFGLSLGVNYPIGGGVAKAQIGYRDAENEIDTKFTRWTVAGAYDYPLSKRTSVYVMGGYTQEKIELKNGPDATPNGFELTSGLLHRF